MRCIILFGIFLVASAQNVTKSSSQNVTNDDGICDCGISNRLGTRIVGGERTTIMKYPWMVGLKIFGYQSCGAALLNGCFILTAGHCTKKLRSPRQVRALLGADSRSDKNSVERKVVEIIRHPDYIPNETHDDIALLRIDPPISYSERIHPICRPKEGEDYLGKTGTVIGFGYTNEDGMPSRTMREVDLTIIDKKQCATIFKDEGRVYEYNLCAGGERGKDACLGDSGGPFIRQDDNGRFEIIGIVSWGVGCARRGIPGVYTQVNRYLPWIEKIINRDGCCKPVKMNDEPVEESKWWQWFLKK